MSDDNKTPAWLKHGTDGRAEVTLSRPLNIGGTNMAALTMREPTVGDQLISEASGDSSAQREIALYANLMEVTPDDIKRLPLKDYRRLQIAFSDFIV